MTITLNKRQPHHWEPIRAERNRLLDITDKYVVPDRGTQEDRDAVTVYRQALRDITNGVEAASRVVWPEPPYCIVELRQPE